VPLTYVSSTLDQFKGSFRHTSLPSTPELSDKPSSSTGEVEATEMLSRTVAGENYPSIGAVVMKNYERLQPWSTPKRMSLLRINHS
jgi:hypothetical protein